MHIHFKNMWVPALVCVCIKYVNTHECMCTNAGLGYSATTKDTVPWHWWGCTDSDHFPVSSCLCFEWTCNVSDPWLQAVNLEVQFPIQIFTQEIFKMCCCDFSPLSIHYTLVCNTSLTVKWFAGNFAESEMEESTKLVGVNSANSN